MIGGLLVLALAAPTVSPTPGRTAIGLAMNLPPSAPPAVRQRAFDEVRRAGVSLFALELQWPAAEPRPGRYDVAELSRAARLLRQSGAVLHLDLPLVVASRRIVPPELVPIAFDDPKLSVRLGELLEALGPALLDFSTISLGNEADAYFAASPDELPPFRRLVAGAVEFLRKRAPRLLVGVTTAAPTDSPVPAVVAALHEKSSVILHVYAPFERGAAFRHRAPATLETDWKAILSAARGRPVAFTEVSYSSAPENGSSPARQAEFVRRMRRFAAASRNDRLLFVRYVPWRDPPPPDRRRTPAAAGVASREAFFANRGLQSFDGTAKPAWKELALPAEARARPPTSPRGGPPSSR